MILLTLLSAALQADAAKTVAAGSGIAACLAVVLLLPDVRRLLFFQALALFVIGIALMLMAKPSSDNISWLVSLSRYTPLLSMVVAVGGLRMGMLDFIDPSSELPKGKSAYAKTLVAVTLFGSIINISGPILITDRLTANKKLDLFTSSRITRTFCACSAWSPFFGGMAVVLVYTGSTSIASLMMYGLPFTLTSLLFVYWSGIARNPKAVAAFEGFPIGVQSLAAPVVLSLIVLLVYGFYPQISIVIVITAASVALPIVYLSVKKGLGQMLSRYQHHISTEFCKSQNELLLFLAAGILASGLGNYLNGLDIALPIQAFGAFEAAVLLAGMIVVAALGVHPVIQIAVLTPLLQPLSPQINLLAMVYLFSWALGTCGSPMSGTNLVVQGRYGISSWQGALRNWPYVAVMYWVAVLILYWIAL